MDIYYAFSATALDLCSAQMILRGENSAGVEEHPKSRAGFFHKHHSMLCTNFLMRRAAHARALSWLSSLEGLHHTLLVLRGLCATSLSPPARCLWLRKQQQGKEGCLWATNARSWCLHPALQQRAIAHSEFTNATVSLWSLITLITFF